MVRLMCQMGQVWYALFSVFASSHLTPVTLLSKCRQVAWLVLMIPVLPVLTKCERMEPVSPAVCLVVVEVVVASGSECAGSKCILTNNVVYPEIDKQ